MKPSALHERIRTEIEGAILSGALAPGAKIPSEAELMAQYGCARMTVNKALSALAGAGLLERRKRAGSFVARPRAESLVLAIPDLAADIAARGQAYGWRRLTHAVVPAQPRDWAGHFPPRAQVVALTGVHLADGEAFAHEERLISLSAVPEVGQADFLEEAPGGWLLHHIPWTQAENRIGAAAASAAVARALGVPAGSACLTLERRTWRGEDSVTLVRQSFLAGHYELIARFGAA